MGCNHNNLSGRTTGHKRKRSESRERELENVAGVFENRREFCRAVRRCLINDLLEAAENENRRRRRHCRRS
ncbi:hypothetical protein [Bacillus sp. FJAT-27445]|uniref:hypothetical protein n=1 Tax=Bacillus sp. FJAT-27445 TaxID=1679166 RepID=UPI00074349CD|nr:hypothetical protein [Bacillus sp. FJAT-27445]